MKKIKAEDMHCEMCVERIQKAMDKAGLRCKISLENKTVEVEDAHAEEAIEILDDLGFEAVEV